MKRRQQSIFFLSRLLIRLDDAGSVESKFVNSMNNSTENEVLEQKLFLVQIKSELDQILVSGHHKINWKAT